MAPTDHLNNVHVFRFLFLVFVSIKTITIQVPHSSFSRNISKIVIKKFRKQNQVSCSCFQFMIALSYHS